MRQWQAFSAKQTAIVHVFHPAITDVRDWRFDLRLHCNSVGTSSATEQIARDEKRAMVFAKLISSSGPSAGPFKCRLPTEWQCPLRQATQAH
jgi:hypothetical protein